MNFTLPDHLIASYKNKKPLTGFNGLSEFTYNRTYSRLKANGEKETWFDTVKRVVEGCYSMQKEWALDNGLPWDEDKALGSALVMFELIFTLKFTPPGRGLWAMGTSITTERKLFMALNNCAFISTKDIDVKYSMPFAFLMDVSMLGVGCGFDVKGAGKINIQAIQLAEETNQVARQNNNVKIRALNDQLSDLIALKMEELHSLYNEYEPPAPGQFDSKMSLINSIKDSIKLFMADIDSNLKYINNKIIYHRVGDSREGWVAAFTALLDNYLRPEQTLPFILDYSDVRPPGTLLKGFGGKSSGPEPLMDLFIRVKNIMVESANRPISVTNIADVMNLIGRCVVAGNVRRSSEICLGDANDEEFINLKNYQKNPGRALFGWNSNNSVFADENTDYEAFLPNIIQNGEPGFIWLDNVRKFSRTCDEPDNKDKDAIGTNPCAEQTLHDGEICNLVEVYLHHHSTLDEFLHSLKYAFLYAKVVTLGDLHWPETDKIVKKNRRIGTSVSGIADFLTRYIDIKNAEIKEANPFISDAKLAEQAREEGLEMGLGVLKEWCDIGYKTIQKYDETYSKWLGVNKSIKITSIKPSGCVTGDTRVLVSDSPDGNFTPKTMHEIISANVGSADISLGAEKTFVRTKKMLYVKDIKGHPQQVDCVYFNQDEEVFEVPLGPHGSIKCTGGHKLLVKNKDGLGEWRAVRDLLPGDIIMGHQPNRIA